MSRIVILFCRQQLQLMREPRQAEDLIKFACASFEIVSTDWRSYIDTQSVVVSCLRLDLRRVQLISVDVVFAKFCGRQHNLQHVFIGSFWNVWT